MADTWLAVVNIRGEHGARRSWHPEPERAWRWCAEQVGRDAQPWIDMFVVNGADWTDEDELIGCGSVFSNGSDRFSAKVERPALDATCHECGHPIRP